MRLFYLTGATYNDPRPVKILQKVLDSDDDQNHHQNVIVFYLRTFISHLSKSIHILLSYPVHELRSKQISAFAPE